MFWATMHPTQLSPHNTTSHTTLGKHSHATQGCAHNSMQYRPQAAAAHKAASIDCKQFTMVTPTFLGNNASHTSLTPQHNKPHHSWQALTCNTGLCTQQHAVQATCSCNTQGSMHCKQGTMVTPTFLGTNASHKALATQDNKPHHSWQALTCNTGLCTQLQAVQATGSCNTQGSKH